LQHQKALSIRIYYYLSYIVDEPERVSNQGGVIGSDDVESRPKNTEHGDSVYEPVYDRCSFAIGNYQDIPNYDENTIFPTMLNLSIK